MPSQSRVSRIYSEGVKELETKHEQSFPYESDLVLKTDIKNSFYFDRNTVSGK